MSEGNYAVDEAGRVLRTAGPGESRLIVVLVAALPRLGPLNDLLDSLSRTRLPHGYRLHTVVVDNGRAQSVPVRAGVTVVHEPVPGIVSARNRTIEVAMPLDPWAVAIVDDDEVVSPDWLAGMIETQGAYGADVVTGPVEFILPQGFEWTAALVERFLKPPKPEGPYSGNVATNNVLVLAHWFDGPSAFRFDPAFNFTGGEDVDLFRRMREGGATVVWSPSGGVTEHVPAERVTPGALRRRAKRNGQLEVRHVLATGSSTRGVQLLRAMYRGVKSTVRYAVVGLVVPQHRELGLLGMARAIGQWRAAAGMRQYEEYSRESI